MENVAELIVDKLKELDTRMENKMDRQAI